MSRFLYLFIFILYAMAVLVTPAFFVAPVLADMPEEAGIGGVTDPGILPDSGFYFFKKLSRNFQLMFTGSDAGKAGLLLKYSNEDALALKEMYGAGKYDAGSKYTEQYELRVQNTVQTIAQVRATQGEDVSGELAGTLRNNYLQQQEALLSVLENVPEAAQNALLNAIDNSNKQVASMVMAQGGEAALQQYQEQVFQQTNNIGEETKIKVQQRLVVVHGHAGQNSNDIGQSNVSQTQNQNQNQMQSQADNQITGQTVQQNGIQNQETGQSATTSENNTQDTGQGKQQGK